MASLLRSIVAGPRSRHPEANLDLCYVTPFLIATSGPSGTYPQRAYRNPLDQLVKFLDYKHGEEWAIWEFRAEGTGYPDSEVYNRIWHYPWPDHHPPPFRLVPLIVGGMKRWLSEKEKDDQGRQRVVVVHCKAGKGRSGTMACSYLISECGWTASEALARFTERRMRPGFGQGVSIPSQLRWVGYVDRWTKSGKMYVEREIEILEVHVWGLRDGVKVQIEGYIDEGKKIHLFHCFNRKERFVIEAGSPGGNGFIDTISDMAGFQSSSRASGTSGSASSSSSNIKGISPPQKSATQPVLSSKTGTPSTTAALTPTKPQEQQEQHAEAGGQAVTFRPSTPIILPTSDVNIDFERRNRASMGGLTMVTSVAHVWFNCFFEGNGPENHASSPSRGPDNAGVFEIEWDAMDGIKGSSRKGTRAFDRLVVVWRAAASSPPSPSLSSRAAATTSLPSTETKPAPHPLDTTAGDKQADHVVAEPSSSTDSPIPQMRPADWHGASGNQIYPSQDHRELGLRRESPAASSTAVSKANSIRSAHSGVGLSGDADSIDEGVRPCGVDGGEDLNGAPEHGSGDGEGQKN